MGKFLKYFAVILLVIILFFSAIPGGALAAEPIDNSKLIALTFDDGPGQYTGKLLNALLQRNANATFFVQGWRLNESVSFQGFLRRMVEEGHQIGNHTYNHVNLSQCTEDEILSQLQQCNEYLTAAGGAGTYAIRPPGGVYNSTLQELANSPIILWSLDPLDWKYQDKDRAVNYVVSKAQNGDIVLMHDTVASSVDAAIEIVDKLQAKGFEFVTVNELMSRRGIEMENGKVYSHARIETKSNCPFSDVKESDWFYEAVCFVTDNSLFSGTSSNHFSPKISMTRGMFATVLGVFDSHGQTDTSTPFSDVSSSAYYAAHILWAYQNSIISGYGNGKFGPEDPITREQASVIMVQYLRYLGILSDEIGQQPLKYTDSHSISSWATKAVAICTELGLFAGDTDGRFYPQRNITRSEAAAVFMSFCRYINESEFGQA